MPSPSPSPAPTSLQHRLHAARYHRTRWAWLSPAGLAAVGFGASLVGEATMRKERGEPYAAVGTLALCVVNAGLCLFGEAVKHGTLAEATRADG